VVSFVGKGRRRVGPCCRVARSSHFFINAIKTGSLENEQCFLPADDETNFDFFVNTEVQMMY
jgi:hypothetical protein